MLLAGLEGSLVYNYGPAQYTQSEMWGLVWALVPQLMTNRIRYGRYLDVFVTHAPPAGIHDAPDPAHQGVKAFLWLDQVFRPRFHFHGHVHVYSPEMKTETRLGSTWVINTYGYKLSEIK